MVFSGHRVTWIDTLHPCVGEELAFSGDEVCDRQAWIGSDCIHAWVTNLRLYVVRFVVDTRELILSASVQG